MAREPVVPLAPGVWRVRLVGDLVNGFILRDDDGQVTLVDMGVRSSASKVLAALTSIGSAPAEVTRLLLTHAHPDHAGGAAQVSEKTGRGVQIHEADAPFAQRGASPPRDEGTLVGRLANRLGGGGFTPLTVAETFTDGDVIPFAGGIEVVHTPGHSPGHASFLLRESGVLLTGDAIFNVRGLRWPIRAFCTDFRMTTRTAHRLAELDYTTAAFTHGPELSDGPREQIRRFLAAHPPRD